MLSAISILPIDTKVNSAVEMAIKASSTAEAEGILCRLWKTWVLA